MRRCKRREQLPEGKGEASGIEDGELSPHPLRAPERMPRAGAGSDICQRASGLLSRGNDARVTRVPEDSVAGILRLRHQLILTRKPYASWPSPPCGVLAGRVSLLRQLPAVGRSGWTGSRRSVRPLWPSAGRSRRDRAGTGRMENDRGRSRSEASRPTVPPASPGVFPMSKRWMPIPRAIA